MNIKIEFLFEYNSKDNLYYIVDYRVKIKDRNERKNILKSVKSLGLVSVIHQPDEKLAELLGKELDIHPSVFKFTVK